MNRRLFIVLLIVANGLLPSLAGATQHIKLRSPAKGVVCDAYICADAAGVSDSLTRKYLGENKEKRLASQGEFDRTSFTFANGVFCDIKEKKCRKDRYFGDDGKPSGVLDNTTTRLLFMP